MVVLTRVPEIELSARALNLGREYRDLIALPEPIVERDVRGLAPFLCEGVSTPHSAGVVRSYRSWFGHAILITVRVESLEVPVVLKRIFPLVDAVSLTDILMFAAGLVRYPDKETIAAVLIAGVCVTPDAITVVPSHNFTKNPPLPAVS